MKEFMPGKPGWVDRGPAPRNTFDRCPNIPETGEVSIVTYRNADGVETGYSRPYTESERAAVIEQGRLNPRKLSLEEARTAEANRRQYLEDALSFEKGLGA